MNPADSVHLIPALAPERRESEPCDEMLTKEGLAGRLKVSVRTIEQWQHDGHLPYLKVGQVLLFYWPLVVKHLMENFTVHRSSPEATTATAGTSTPHPDPLPDRGGEAIKLSRRGA